MRFQSRALTPQQEKAIRFAVRSGADCNELAAAYGVHRRTIKRTVERAALPFVDVEVGGYRATFEIDETGPIQRTGWRASS